MNTQSPNKKASKMHVFLYVLIVILVLGLIARPGDPIIVSGGSDAPAPAPTVDNTICPVAFNLIGCSSLQVNPGQLRKGSSASFFFKLDEGKTWPETVTVIGADLAGYEPIEGDPNICKVSIENVRDGVLISIPGLVPLTVSSGEAKIISGPTKYVQLESSPKIVFQALDHLVEWPSDITVEGVDFTFNINPDDASQLVLQLGKITGPVLISFETNRTHRYIPAGNYELNENFVPKAFDQTLLVHFPAVTPTQDVTLRFGSGSLNYVKRYTESTTTVHISSANFDFHRCFVLIHPYEVSPDFYEWFSANTTRTG